MNGYVQAFKKYAVFDGRASRAEYWSFFVINLIVTLVLIVADVGMDQLNPEFGVGFLSGIYILFQTLPSIAICVRRLHDSGRSGWWFMVGFIALIGTLILLILLLLKSQTGPNRYGPNPRDERNRTREVPSIDPKQTGDASYLDLKNRRDS